MGWGEAGAAPATGKEPGERPGGGAEMNFRGLGGWGTLPNPPLRLPPAALAPRPRPSSLSRTLPSP